MYLGVEAFRAAKKNGTISMRLPRAKPTGAQIYFIGATNVPDPEPRPSPHPAGPHGSPHHLPDADEGGPEGHLRPVSREGRPRAGPRQPSAPRRDRAHHRGYSPAMIDQICSMALTNAHHEGQAAFTWRHLVDSMVVIESGTAINVELQRRRRARGRDPRGRARGSRARLRSRARVEPALDQDARRALGHHQSFEKEERFGALPEPRVRRHDPQRRRDGGRARLLRRELGRRLRRPELDHLDRRIDGRERGHVTAADRPPRQDIPGRERRGDA